MSLKFRDKNGAEHVLAGLTPGGDIEYGAVATRNGTVTMTGGGTGTWFSGTATFSDAMPDADYLIYIEMPNNPGYGPNVFEISNKTKNGFTITAFHHATTTGTSFSVKYTAYKLYTVADAEALYSKVLDIEAMIPSSASSTNKFATADDIRTETKSLDRRLDDVEDVIPSSASISNKLATAEDVEEAMANAGLPVCSEVPSSPKDKDVILYIGEETGFTKGGIYQYVADPGAWVLISTADVDLSKYETSWTGTKAEWDALSTSEKKQYKIANITDDVIGGEVADEVTDGLMSPVTSNAVFDALKTRANVFSLTPKKGVTYDISVDNRYGVVGILLTRNNSGQAMYLLYAGFVATPTEGTEGGTLNLIDGAHITYTQSSSTEGTFVFFGYTNQTWHITEITS